MPHCDNCGAHVTAGFKRGFADNSGTLHACPECTNPATLVRDAAGLSSAYQARTDTEGRCIPTDGGDEA